VSTQPSPHLRVGLSTVLLLALALQAGEARAEFPGRALYVGVFGGGTIRLRDWDLGANAGTDGLQPNHSGMVGLRVGFHVLSRLALEAGLAVLPMTSSLGESNTVLTYGLDVIFHVLKTNWTPVVEAGFGAYHAVSGDLGTDSDPRVHFGVGLRGLLTSFMALRVDLRDVISDGFDSWGSNNLELTAGLDFFVFRARVGPPDRDHDGIADSEDACPDEAGPRATRGCPDSDGDGVADRDDRCPSDPGTVQLAGCPDADHDGVEDSKDLCPTEYGKVEFRGCPDTDNDGISDKDDRCPKEAGKRETRGCPDGDNDSVADREDRCPKEPGPFELKGCPDRDHDGVPDIDDKCPDKPGVKELAGCLPEVLEKKFSGAIKGIYFATGSAKVQRRSRKLLDEAVVALSAYPTLRLRIEGHTDSRGDAEKNRALSQARAESVRDHLVSKGIEAGRIEAVGLGDARPVADNKTAAGRAANRRIEFIPLGSS
jgi:outer membrane protein OmpA-like peptidoglycan-associated protein